jgi:hypothetical protein
VPGSRLYPKSCDDYRIDDPRLYFMITSDFYSSVAQFIAMPIPTRPMLVTPILLLLFQKYWRDGENLMAAAPGEKPFRCCADLAAEKPSGNS